MALTLPDVSIKLQYFEVHWLIFLFFSEVFIHQCDQQKLWTPEICHKFLILFLSKLTLTTSHTKTANRITIKNICQVYENKKNQKADILLKIILQQLQLTGTIKDFFLSVKTIVFIHINQLFPLFSHSLWTLYKHTFLTLNENLSKIPETLSTQVNITLFSLFIYLIVWKHKIRWWIPKEHKLCISRINTPLTVQRVQIAGGETFSTAEKWKYEAWLQFPEKEESNKKSLQWGTYTYR